MFLQFDTKTSVKLQVAAYITETIGIPRRKKGTTLYKHVCVVKCALHLFRSNAEDTQVVHNTKLVEIIKNFTLSLA